MLQHVIRLRFELYLKTYYQFTFRCSVDRHEHSYFLIVNAQLCMCFLVTLGEVCRTFDRWISIQASKSFINICLPLKGLSNTKIKVLLGNVAFGLAGWETLHKTFMIWFNKKWNLHSENIG